MNDRTKEDEERDEALEVFFQISSALIGNQSLDEILYQIVVRTADLVDSKICSLMMLNEEKGTLEIKATQSLSAEYREKPPIKIGQSVSGKVVMEKKVIQVEDVTKDPMYGFPEIARQNGLKSLLSVPMLVGAKVIGVINSYTEEVRVFDPHEIRLVRTMANHAAMAIEHVHMRAKEEKARTALETRKSVDQAKRILMKKYQMDEEAAHRLIQKMSMDRNKPVGEVASAIVMAAELK